MGFDETLATLYPDDPEVPEIAWLDWNLRRAFSDANAPVPDQAQFASADWSSVRLRLAPSFRHKALATNAPALWQALSRGDTPPSVDILAGMAGLAVWRHGLEPLFRTLDADEYLAVQALANGVSFATVCTDLDARQPGVETTLTASGWLSEWLSSGLICGLY